VAKLKRKLMEAKIKNGEAGAAERLAFAAADHARESAHKKRKRSDPARGADQGGRRGEGEAAGAKQPSNGPEVQFIGLVAGGGGAAHVNVAEFCGRYGLELYESAHDGNCYPDSIRAALQRQPQVQAAHRKLSKEQVREFVTSKPAEIFAKNTPRREVAADAWRAKCMSRLKVFSAAHPNAVEDNEHLAQALVDRVRLQATDTMWFNESWWPIVSSVFGVKVAMVCLVAEQEAGETIAINKDSLISQVVVHCFDIPGTASESRTFKADDGGSLQSVFDDQLCPCIVIVGDLNRRYQAPPVSPGKKARPPPGTHYKSLIKLNS
jgi:hypothetical protein